MDSVREMQYIQNQNPNEAEKKGVQSMRAPDPNLYSRDFNSY